MNKIRDVPQGPTKQRKICHSSKLSQGTDFTKYSGYSEQGKNKQDGA